MQTCYKMIAVTYITLVFSIVASAQGFTTKITLGGTKDEVVQNFQHTKDGGYIIGGVALSNDGDVTGFKGVSDMWLVKRKADLSPWWNICLGTKFEELGSIVRETQQGDYLVLGLSKSTKGDYDVILAKVSQSGKFLWQRIFGGSGNEWVNNLHEFADGSIMISATTGSNDRDVSGNNGGSDVWLLKLNADGTLIWKKTYGGNSQEIVQTFEGTPDGGAVIGTSTRSSNFEGFIGQPYDAWIFKVNDSGTIEWNHLLKTSNMEQLMKIKRRPAGDYIFAICAQGNDYDFTSSNPLNNIWIIRIESDGQIAEKIEFDNGGSDILRDLIITPTNDVVIAGDYFIGSAPTFSWIFKLDASLQNKKEIFLTSSGVNKPYMVRQTHDFGFIVMEQNIVNNQRNVRLTKLNSDLEFVWDKSFGGPGDEEFCDCGGWWAKDPWWNKEMPATFFPSKVLEDAQGNYYFAVRTTTNGGDVSGVHQPRKGTAADIWFVKFNPGTTASYLVSKEASVNEVVNVFKHTIYPNPARGSAVLSFTAAESAETTIEIYNIQGSRVRTEKIGTANKGNTYHYRIDLSNMPAGSYLYQLRNGTNIGRGTVIKIE